MAQETTGTFEGSNASFISLNDDILSVYSQEMIFKAQPNNRFLNFAKIEYSLQFGGGDTVKIIRWGNLSGDPVHVEGGSVTTSNMNADTISIAVTQHIKALEFSEKLLVTAPMDLLSVAAGRLAQHWSNWGPERLLKNTALTGATTVVYAGAATSRATVAAGDVLDATALKDAREALASYDAPMFDFGNGQMAYVGIFHPHQTRSLKDDPEWISMNNYLGTREIMQGEVGMFDGIVIIESTNMPYGGAAAASPAFYDVNADSTNDLSVAGHGGNVNVYLGAVFGNDYLAFAPLGDLEMRDGGADEFGLNHKLAWYQMYGAGILWADYGVRIETA